MTCLYEWLGDEWSLISEMCMSGEGCKPPTVDGIFIGEQMNTECGNVGMGSLGHGDSLAESDSDSTSEAETEDDLRGGAMMMKRRRHRMMG